MGGGMKSLFIAFLLIVAVAAQASADFNAGLDAYLKEDYQTAFSEFKPLAEEGDANAQYMLGYMYTTGKAVLQDYTQAHMWFNLAAARGNRKAATSRDEVAKLMTPAQIAEAQKMAKEWEPKKVSEKPIKQEEVKAPSSGMELIRAVQENLTTLGYDPGPADGKMGSRTRAAIRLYQDKAGLTVDGRPSQTLLDHLEADVDKKQAKSKAGEKPSSASASTDMMTAPGLQTLEVLDQLKAITEKGARKRMANSEFLSELNRLIKSYGWPWRELLLQDGFEDGNYTVNPAWVVASGDFWIDKRFQLRSVMKVPSQKQVESSEKDQDSTARIIGAILGEIMKEQQSKSETTPEPSQAEIYTTIPITNAFSIGLELSISAGVGSSKIEFGTYRGEEREEGYRMVYFSGGSPFIEMTRLMYGGSSVIHVSETVPVLEYGDIHFIQWRRYEDGDMIVLIDGKQILSTVDRGFRKGFEGFTLINHSGDYTIPSIVIHGTLK
jgi:peptidoglycan hydrolase-like protein with peptidoglycan-binding domain